MAAPAREFHRIVRFALLLSLCCLVVPAWAAKPVAGKPAPDIVATTIDGKPFSSKAQLGKVLIVNFWATWCSPCRQEMPTLDAFYRQHRDEGLEMIAISVDDPTDLPQVKSVMAQFQFPAAMLHDTKARGYGHLSRMPLTFVVDRHGVLRRNAWTAAPIVDAETLQSEVLPLLAEP
jgi:thiol-disulfide isomerase/thioredoxin